MRDLRNYKDICSYFYKMTFLLEEIKNKLESYCAYQERCHKEVENKLTEYRLIPQAKDKILLHLIENDFLNEERFAKTFARGKFRIKKWGKQRIIKELRLKGISEYNIKSALNEIDDEAYICTFNELAEKRCTQLTDKNKYKKRKKLADYLLYRGWESVLVFEKVKALIR